MKPSPTRNLIQDKQNFHPED